METLKVLLKDPRERDTSQQGNLLFFMILMSGMLLWLSFQTPPPAPPVDPAATPAGTTTAGVPAATLPDEAVALESGLTLPPVAEAPATDDEVLVQDEFLKLSFTRVGGRLKRAEVLLGENHRDSIQLVPVAPEGVTDAEVAYPFGLRFASNYLGEALDRRRWEATADPDGRGVKFALEVPGEARVEKSFRLTDRPHVIAAAVNYTSLRTDKSTVLGLDQTEPAFSLTWAPNVASNDVNKGVHQEIVFHSEAGNEHYPTTGLEGPKPSSRFSEHSATAAWAAIKSAYFVVAMKPGFERGESWVLGDVNHFTLGVGLPRTEVASGATVTSQFDTYIGPSHLSTLRQGWDGLEEVLQFFTMSGFGWMDSFAKVLLTILNWFYASVFSNYGVAIIFLTVLVRTVMFPLTFKSMKSMKKMQKLAPEMEKIKAEVGDNQQEMQKRMMGLYQEHGVNPISGCFPILLQMPVFIALYRMLWSAFELRRAEFLWMVDLSEPDRLFKLPFEIPVPFAAHPVDAVNLLPFLMGLAMVASTRLMPTSTAMQNPQQKFIMNAMPVIFCVFCYSMPSGLNLYILTSTVLGIVQNYLVHVSDDDMREKKKPRRRTGEGSKHFYDVAQARKREIHKEQRRDKKQKTNRADGRVPQQDEGAGKPKR
jgi:YidC/Oxa1 family membrane protein insertase